MRRPLLLLLVTALLCGCAERDAARSAASPTPSPVGACPATQVPDREAAACAAYDPERAMAENEAYRERLPVRPGAGGGQHPTAAAERAERVLEELALRIPEPTGLQIREALESAGFSSSVQAYTGTGYVDRPSRAYAVGIDLGGVCVTGGLRHGVAELEVAGGYIADGGCLAIDAH